MANELGRSAPASDRNREHGELFQLLLDNVQDGVWAAATDGQMLYQNAANESIYGRPKNEFFSNPSLWREVIHPEDGPEADRSVEELFERHAARAEYRIVWPDGEIRWVLDRKILVSNPDNRSDIIGGIVTDITERKQVEEALRASEERFDLAVKGSSDGLWDWQIDTGAEWWSPRLHEMLGYDDGEIATNYGSFQDLLHADDKDRTLEAMRAHLEEHVPFDVEHRLRTKQGEYRWMRGRGQAFWDSTGKPIRMAGSILDLTQQQQAENELRESESRLQLALEAINGGVWDWTVSTGEVHFTPSWPRMLGYEPDEIDNHVRTWEEALHPEDKPRVMTLLKDHFAGRSNYYSEHRMRTKGGDWIWVLDRGQVVERDEDGKPLRMMGTDVNIDQRKRVEEERSKLEAKVQQTQKLESLGILAGGVAHDFNNVLSVILGSAELASQALASSTPAEEHIERIRTSSLQAAELCQQLLAYAGKGQFEVRVFDVSEFVRETFPLLRASISKNASLFLELTDELPAVQADVSQIRQVLMNLVINASDAIGEAVGNITLRTRLARAQIDPGEKRLDHGLPPGESVVVEVEDDGAGMDEKTRARMFDPFFTTKFTGRGLGLAAVLGIVRAHQGAIDVRSSAGEGATLRVFLPPSSRSSLSVVATEPAESEWRSNASVLVVDDDGGVRGLATEILESRGLRVLTASDGVDAVEVYRERSGEIDVVLLDLTMPRMGGRECLRELRRINTEAKVLLSSGYNEQSSLGVVSDEKTGFIHKPFLQRDFLSSFRVILEG